MLYLGIDQHARQLTISLRDDSGDVLLARQVSTRPEKVQAFFTKPTRERLRDGCVQQDDSIRIRSDVSCRGRALASRST